MKILNAPVVIPLLVAAILVVTGFVSSVAEVGWRATLIFAAAYLVGRAWIRRGLA